MPRSKPKAQKSSLNTLLGVIEKITHPTGRGGKASNKPQATRAATRQTRNQKHGPRGRPGSAITDGSFLGTASGHKGKAAPVAVVSSLPKIGMSDLSAHEISWQAGTIYVGNGTGGINDQLYFMDNSSNLYNGVIPFLASDALVGQSYCSDIEKHYATKRVRNAWVTLHALQPSTANSCEVLIAPVRGGGQSVNTARFTSATAGLAYAAVSAMSQCRQATTWEDCILPLADFIATGFGAKENEVILNSVAGAGTGIGAEVVGNVLTGFAISGKNSTTALRGQQTHAVICHEVNDYCDFIASLPQTLAAPTDLSEPFSRTPDGRSSYFHTLERMRRKNTYLTQLFASFDQKQVDQKGFVVAVGTERFQPKSGLSGLAAAGVTPIRTYMSVDELDEKERFSPKRSSSLGPDTNKRKFGS